MPPTQPVIVLPAMDPARRRARYDDLLALPEEVHAEILGGEITTLPAPRPRHSKPQGALRRFIGGPFDDDDGFGGPGGWWIFVEVDVQLGDDVVRPDLSGWRRERWPEPDTRPIQVVPDWVCEVLSRVERGTRQSRTRSAAACTQAWRGPLLDRGSHGPDSRGADARGWAVRVDAELVRRRRPPLGLSRSMPSSSRSGGYFCPSARVFEVGGNFACRAPTLHSAMLPVNGRREPDPGRARVAHCRRSVLAACAHRIVAQNPNLDPSDVYHTLRNFQRSPEERLRRGLRHGRTRTRAL